MTDPTPQPAAPQPAAPFTEAEDKQYSTLATFLNIIYLIPGLIFYFAFGSRGPKIAVQSKENLNWTINVTAIWIICGILSIIPFIGVLFLIINFAVFVLNLIFSILGGVAVNNGQSYRYPINIRWIK
jgi:uncharacterized Tic20 family protein